MSLSDVHIRSIAHRIYILLQITTSMHTTFMIIILMMTQVISPYNLALAFTNNVHEDTHRNPNIGESFYLVHDVEGFDADKWPIFEKDGKDAVMKALKSWIKDAEKSIPMSSRTPSPKHWEDQVVYNIVVDRFHDGNTTLNTLNLPPYQEDEIRESNYMHIGDYREGGDILGIMQRLDYLKLLGITTIWMTPVLKHDGSYHGYCTTDPTQIDPGFGTNEDFRLLVKEAHTRGIKVIMDIVINHMCDTKTHYATHSYNRHACAQSLWEASWSGHPSSGSNRGHLNFSSEFFGPFQSQHFFSRCGANTAEETSGESHLTMFGDFVEGMFDFDTRNYDFHDIFTEVYKFWIAYADVDGFRLDAAKHVTEDFTAHFSTHIRHYAHTLGKHNFYIVGEVAGNMHWQVRRLGASGLDLNTIAPLDSSIHIPASLSQKVHILKPIFSQHPISKYPGLDAVYDFYMGGTTRNMILQYAKTPQGGSEKYDSSPQRLAEYFKSDYSHLISQKTNPRQSWIPLEIHDWPRLLKNEHQKNPLDTLSQSLIFLFTAPGTPIIYYGMEQALSGSCPPTKRIFLPAPLSTPSSTTRKHPSKKASERLMMLCQDDSYSNHALARQAFFMSSRWRLRSAQPNIDMYASVGLQAPEAAAFIIPTSGKRVKTLTIEKYQWRNDPYLNTRSYMFMVTSMWIEIRRSCSVFRRGEMRVRLAREDGVFGFSRVLKQDSVDGDDSLDRNTHGKSTFAGYEGVVLMHVGRRGSVVIKSEELHMEEGVSFAGDVFVRVGGGADVRAVVEISKDGVPVLVFLGTGNGLDTHKRIDGITVSARETLVLVPERIAHVRRTLGCAARPKP